MSRTDRHRPYDVQARDPYEKRFYWFDQGIGWGWRKVFVFRDCNCRAWYCCGSYWRIKRNRSLRHRDQQRAREAVKGDMQAWDGRLKTKFW